ncbi:MAG: response regulator [Dehalococcoidia bacterium]|nr:response regulator [Dehalococcoidia bacterium]
MKLQTTNKTRGAKMESSVMIIGDEEIASSNLASLLEEAGIKVAAACNWTSCLENLREISPSVVIVEEESGSEGWEIASQIRRESDIPIVILGTINSELAWVKAAAHGIDCYLARPFGPTELVARLKSLIRRHESIQQKPQHVGSYEVAS